MDAVEPITVNLVGGLTPEIEEYLGRDPVRNAFTIYDLREEPERSHLWVSRVGGTPRAHLLVHDFPEFQMVHAHFSGEPAAAEQLVDLLPTQRAVIIAPPPLVPLVTDQVRNCRVILEDVMAVNARAASLDPSPSAVRLAPEWAEEYARLVVPESIEITPAVIERNREHLRDEIIYGVFSGKRLVSVAGSAVRTRQVWIVGGVETLPSFRRRGYARQVTSAVTRDAVSSVRVAGLWVRSDNAAAIGLYSGLGYRTMGESAWIDVGTGMEP